jgi:hypothetical protein
MELKDFIRIHDNLIPREVCQDLIRAYDASRLSQAAKVGEHRHTDPSMRHCDVLSLLDPDLAKRSPELHRFVPYYLQRFTAELKRYLEAFPVLSNVGSFALTQLDILKYARGHGFYRWHPDSTRSTSQRVLSALLYLNDVEEGGETEFSYAETKILPRSGRLAIFPAAWLFEHRGVGPVSDDKYVIVSWMAFQK